MIRKLWEGEPDEPPRPHYTVENARIYTLPDEPPPILVAAGGRARPSSPGGSATASSRPRPTRSSSTAFDERGRRGQAAVRPADRLLGRGREASARRDGARVVAERRRSRGELGQELPLPTHFEQAAAMVDRGGRRQGDRLRPRSRARTCAAIQEYVDAGFDHVYVHQVGPDQEGFFRFYEREILPGFA